MRCPRLVMVNPSRSGPLRDRAGGEARDVLAFMTSMLRTPAHSGSIRAACRRAFTLVELMVVVSIVAVLAVIALVGFRKYMNAAHSSEAVSVIGSIKNAQESYRAETLAYLNVSTTLDTFYPRQDPDDRKMAWGGTHADLAKWRQLNVDPGGPTLYSFATIAGLPNQAVTTGGIKVVNKPTFALPVEPWYLIQAIGDVDGDNDNFYALASSFTTTVYIEKDDE